MDNKETDNGAKKEGSINSQPSELQKMKIESPDFEINENTYDAKKERFSQKTIILYILSGILILIASFFIFVLKCLYKEKEENRRLNILIKNMELNANKDNINLENNQTLSPFNNNEYKEDTNIIIDYNQPLLPLNNTEHIVKKFNRTYYNSSHPRYHFHDLFNNRKLFRINYSYLPYQDIDKSVSYEINANYIYETTGLLNITKLDFFYNNIDINTSDMNHIHLSMGFNKNYILLSSISIASILNTSSPNTYIHFHIILNDCKYEDVIPIINLKKINKNVDFTFYNGKQAEYDFGERGKREWRGVGDYSRILIPEIVNNTNKILIIDSGDTITLKDLSEVYFFDIEDNYFTFSLEDIAGRTDKINIFGRNNFYPNTGICLVNVREFRKDNLYRTAFYSALAYYDLPCPYQDIFLMISNYKFKYWPLNYNCPQFFENDEEMKEKSNDTKTIKHWLRFQRKSPFKYTKEELLETALNPVIIHLTANKPVNGMANERYTPMWINYAKITGLYEEIKKKYPKPFKQYKIE